MTYKQKLKRIKFLREVLESSMLTRGTVFYVEEPKLVSHKRIGIDKKSKNYNAPVLKKRERKILYKWLT